MLINSSVIVDGIDEPIICEYFKTLNEGAFRQTAELFAEEGYLHPPFDTQIQGRSTIVQYLEKEAKGMQFCPELGKILETNSIYTQYQILGKVVTRYFTVNVKWLIQINIRHEILVVEVKLLAALDELLNFKRG